MASHAHDHLMMAASSHSSALSAGDGDRLDIAVDPNTDLIRVTGYGLWSPDCMRRHFADLERIVLQIRKKASAVRVIVDLREAPVQSPEIGDIIASETKRIYLSDDRVAIVVQSSLIKLQMRRSTFPGVHQLFISISAAETWLSAWSHLVVPKNRA